MAALANQTPASVRLPAIDAMRGLAMLIMTFDHVRETFFLHHQVSDPMEIATTDPALFFTRLAAHVCAPMFVFLTGLSAWLYAHPPGGARSATGFLVKRGVFLIALELVVISFAWSGTLPPPVLYLQVIWVIGLSMIALALLHRLPMWLLGLIGTLIVVGHNALAWPGLQPGSMASAAWTILEQRGFLIADAPVKVKVSYPLLPWIGIIVLGYVAGPLFGAATSAALRRRALAWAGLACLLLLIVLRGANLYGEALPWTASGDTLHAVMSFLNLTKYPPSLHFTLMTLGVGMLVLRWFDTARNRFADVCARFGGAPLFYYVLHLYVLLAVQTVLTRFNGGQRLDFAHIGLVWLSTLALIGALYLPCRWFAAYKRRSTSAWVRYL